MTKLLQNKPLIKFLGIALSILLVVALVPQISIAYGSKDDIADETALAETGENAATEGEEVAADGENAAPSEEGAESAEGDEAAEDEVVTIDGVEMVSHKVEVPGEEDENATEDGIAPQSSEDKGKKSARVKSRAVLNPKDAQISIDENIVDYTESSPLKFNGGTHTLTIKEGCTFIGDILITNGAQVTINGEGTIQGTEKGSVIVVEGANDGTKLIFDGPTVRKGSGTVPAKATNWGKIGGGILVARASNWVWGNKGASLEFKSGTVQDNTAEAGGGIFIDYQCGFTMSGGSILNNTATKHEGGGIFTWGNWNGKTGSKSLGYGEITAATIKGNTTATTTDWGGGGVYVNTEGALRIDSARITDNTANALGGGIAGCPHAKIGIGKLEAGAAVYDNTANGGPEPDSDTLRFNMPKTTKIGSSERVPSGDILVYGAKKEQSYKIEDKQTYTAGEGAYASEHFEKELAQDYYCTLASSIDGTDLGDDQGVAWIGFKAEIEPSKVASDNSVKSEDAEWESIKINKGKGISVTDATLCLTSQAKSDPYTRKVIISGNTSGTHGGGIACNGILMFGPRPGTKETVNGYNLTLNKKLITNLSGDEGVALTPGEFKFELSYQEDGETKTCPAANDEDGNVEFKGLPGSKVDGSTVIYTLKEILSPEQTAAGYESPIPEEGWDVVVTQKVTQEVHDISQTRETIYTTEVAGVVINGKTTDTVTNTLNLKAKESVSVTKVADGIAVGSFAIRFKKIDNIGEVVNDPSKPTALKQANSLVSIAAAEGAIVKPIEWQSDEPSTRKTGVVSFDTEEYTAPGTYWYAIAEQNGGTQDVANGVDYDGTTYLVKVDVTLSENKRSLESNPTIYKAAAGATALEDATEIGVKFENVAMEYAEFNLGLTKQILTTLGAPLSLNDRKFSFALYEGENPIAEANPVAQGTTDRTTGKLNLLITDDKYAKEAFGEADHEKEFTFTLKETVPEETDASHVTTISDAKVKVTLSAAGERTKVGDHTMFLVTPTVESVTVNGTDVEVADKAITVTNRYAPHGEWQFQVDKYFYGLGDPRDCSFTMQEIKRAPQAGEPLANVLVANDNLQKWTASATAADFQNNKAAVVFDPIEYQVTAPKANAEADQNIPTAEDARGDHYYLITEDGDDAAKDTTAYVVKVTVAVDKDNPGKLVATEEVIGYADTLDSPFIAYTEKESTSEPVAFYNTDTYGMISAASYSVYAASGEPVDQVCYVDPKIIKNLEGRAIKSGEFAFKLIQVANYNDTEGTVISATTNDEFGMVDFDKANNVSGDLENPSCLAYTKPGTYYYRVIEDTSKGGMNDQSVLYSDQVITFTTVIEQDEATGRLVCTDMYYGYWDKAASKNVRYDEQYTDFDTQPSNIGDMSKLNPDWHPTITNKTRPMDLQVRKTSVSDRNEGLVGATYGLYMVNENAQGDIWLAEATSEDGGWITYKNVSLSTNNLYYFKETAAPAGHTVSEFRSSYFYLVEDASSANGYALQYTDSKYLPEAAADEAAVQAEVSGTVQAKNAPAAQAATEAANEAAADTETQPGYSADGNVLLTYDKDGGVYDEVTTLEVNKLDTRTHEWVEGAKLVILEKESGKEIASWTSGKTPQKLEKTLNVGTTYLLREVEAPDQYRLANDVEFVIDDYGNVSITKGTENGNAELSDNTISLYDTMLDAEETETIEREKSTTEKPNKDTLLAKTGDMLPILGIALVALAALIVVIVAVRRRRAGEDSASNE